MKTYTGTILFDGRKEVTVTCNGQVSELASNGEVLDWGPESLYGGVALAVTLLSDAGCRTCNWDDLFKQVILKLDPDAGWTMSYYDIKSYENAKS